jgi:hypothetical protein
VATWTEVKQYVFQNYKVEDDGGDSMTIRLGGDERTQLVFFAKAGDYLVFSSPIAKVGEVQPGKVLTSSLVFGVIQTADYYSLRHVALMSTLDVAEIDLAILEFGTVADSIESDLNGRLDRF